MPDNDAERCETYVTCQAMLTAFKKDYRWFDDSGAGHDDGVAPLASFVLAEPSTYADRAMSILFKDSAHAATSPPDEADIGRQFTVEVPEDFLKGKSKTIDNASVRHFCKIAGKVLPKAVGYTFQALVTIPPRSVQPIAI